MQSALHKPIATPIYFVKGDGKNQVVTVNGLGEATLAGALIEFRVAAQVGVAALIQKTSAEPTEISVDVQAGSFTILMLADDTSELDAGTYVYTIRITLDGGKPVTVALNNFVLCDTVEEKAA